MPTAIDRLNLHAVDIDGRYAWTRLAVSMLIATVGGVGMWAVVVVLPAVQAEFHVDRGEASLPYTMTMVGFAAGNVFIGRAIDRLGYMLPAVIAAILMACGFILAAAGGSIFQFGLAQGLIGIGTAATFGPLIADVSHWFRKHRGKAVAAAACGNYLAGVVWPLAKPGALAGATLVFAPALGSFLAPDLLGGGKKLLIGSLIQMQFTSSRNWPFGAALSIAITAVILLVMMLRAWKAPAREVRA